MTKGNGAAGREGDDRAALAGEPLRDRIARGCRGNWFIFDLVGHGFQSSAISEAEKATGRLDAARKTARHGNRRTTQGYVRNDGLGDNRKMAKARLTSHK